MQKILVLCVLSLFIVACGHKKDAKTFEAALEASTGQLHTIAKLDTETGDYVVYKNEVTGEYSAYNMAKWDRKTMTSIDQFNAVAVPTDTLRNLKKETQWVESGYWHDIYNSRYEYWDEYDYSCSCYVQESGYVDYYVGTEWIDTSHFYTFYWGAGGYRFENTAGQSKDLETFAALKEEAAEKFMSFKLKSEFSLSANRAEELAKLANRYQKLENSRELTSKEKDKFALDALGVNMNQVEAAIKDKAQGKEKTYQDLLKVAAQVNNTTPEQIGKFFEEMVIE